MPRADRDARLALGEGNLMRAVTAGRRGELHGRPDGPHARLRRLQRRAGNRAVSGLLQRQATGATATAADVVSVSSAGADAVVVVLSDGTRYRVTRTRRPIVARRREPLPPGARVGSDRDRIWVQIDWCRGTRGEIRIGGNPQGAARQLLREIAQQIANGGGADAVVRAVENARITPFADFDIAQSAGWRLSGGVDIAVGSDGVAGGRGRVILRTGPFDFGLEAGYEDGETRVVGQVGVTPGRRDETFTCPTRERVYVRQHTEYRVERDVPAHTEPGIRLVPRWDKHQRYVYFEYARPRPDEKQPTGAIDAARSAHELALLKDDAGSGFRVSSIQGFTSPEGTLEAGPNFQGNEALAKRRAEAVAVLLRSDPAFAGLCLDGCLATGGGAPGDAELYGGGQAELRGRQLEEHAVEEFRRHHAEARHRTPTLLEQIERARSSRARGRLVYPWLRRVVVTLTRMRLEHETYEQSVPQRWVAADAPPSAVVAAAKTHFGLMDALGGR